MTGLRDAILDRELSDRKAYAVASAFHPVNKSGLDVTPAAKLEALSHEIAHCVDLGIPLESDAVVIGHAVGRLPYRDSNINEIAASAITLLVFRKLKIRVARAKKRILSGMEANLHQPEFEEGPEVVNSFFADAAAEFEKALKSPEHKAHADEVIAHLKATNVLAVEGVCAKASK